MSGPWTPVPEPVRLPRGVIMIHVSGVASVQNHEFFIRRSEEKVFQEQLFTPRHKTQFQTRTIYIYIVNFVSYVILQLLLMKVKNSNTFIKDFPLKLLERNHYHFDLFIVKNRSLYFLEVWERYSTYIKTIYLFNTHI